MAADAAVTLGISRTMIVKIKREIIPPPILTIEGGTSGEVLKGTILRTAILDTGAELYRGMTKMTNCGGELTPHPHPHPDSNPNPSPDARRNPNPNQASASAAAAS